MTYLIGTDEAGYGPNLGPLVISGTLWKIPDSARSIDLYTLLSESVCNARPSPGARRIPIADSKQLYKPHGSLKILEQGIFPPFASLGGWPNTWRSLVERFDPAQSKTLDAIPWHSDFDLSLPTESDGEHLQALAQLFQKEMQRHGLGLLAMQGRIIFPEVFNQGVEQYGSKGELLSRATMGIIADLLESIDDSEEEVIIMCDKHGGRNRYAPLLQSTLDVPLLRVDIESRAESRYRFSRKGQPIEITFRSKGEAILPVAIASMLAKYIRELAMHALNQYWKKGLPALQPTAGYPGDAPRFKEDITELQKEWGIEDRQLWRNR